MKDMKSYNVLGMMSGTSLDGLDMAHCQIRHEGGKWSYALGPCTTLKYPNSLQKELQGGIQLDAIALLQLHHSYGRFLGDAAKKFLKEYDLEVDFIASHGHTVHHRPELGLTVQIGSGQHLANASGLHTVCDFRAQDVALGGQGAPLVPVGDRLFFGHYDFCLNLGGISNVSFEKDGQRIAYDIGLANMLLNHICEQHGLSYDEGGALARSGQPIPQLLEALNTLEYYRLPYPKSAGYEWFKKEVIPLLEATTAPLADLLHTGVLHISEQISLPLKAQNLPKGATLLITGGGAHNHFLVETLQDFLGDKVQVQRPENKLIDFKEALIFGLMGVLYWEKLPNALASVTGASLDNCGGVLYRPAYSWD